MRLLKAIAFTASVLSVTACGLADKMGATRAYNYATVHHSAETRGIGIGAEAPFRASPFSIGIEAGAFKDFQNRYPVIGNFLPFVGFQLTVPTVGPHEVRMRVSPGYSSDTAIFSIQSNFVF